MKIQQKKEYTIDAEGKSLGRIASEAASILMGKNIPSFVRHNIPACTVRITNASKVKLTQKKMHTKTYAQYSGYPSGLKIHTMKKVAHDKGFSEVFRRTIYRMLPSNKLRRAMMKNLIVTE